MKSGSIHWAGGKYDVVAYPHSCHSLQNHCTNLKSSNPSNVAANTKSCVISRNSPGPPLQPFFHLAVVGRNDLCITAV